MSICEKCKQYNNSYHLPKDNNWYTLSFSPFYYDIVKSCTTNENGEHHSYNDEPAIIYENESMDWLKNNKRHREDKPARMLYTKSTGELEPIFYYKDIKNVYIENVKPINNTINIKLTNIEQFFTKQYNNKTAIVLKELEKIETFMNYYVPYLCLIDNEILHFVFIYERFTK